MLSVVAFSLFLFSFSELVIAYPHSGSCPARLQEQSSIEQFSTENSLKIVEAMKEDKDFQTFLTESSQKRAVALADPEFQNFVITLQTQIPTQVPQLKHQLDYKSQPGELYIFVSFSLGEKALLNLAQEAKRWNATLVLRGFIDGSYAKTAKALQNIIIKTGQGFIIDPELFSLFSITAVPTYVLAKPFQLNAIERTSTPLHDRIQGHVSIHYALELFAKEGGLREEAQLLLKQRDAE